MYFSKIKTRHIYNVIFDPVKPCEFDKKHLAVVLKKNNDKQTLIVMPLTSEENGNGINKINIGIIDSLPSSLKCNNTYAVFNQIRTVNASRFISLKEGNSIIESKMDDNLFFKLVGLGMNDITHNFDYDERIHLFKTQYEQACVLKSVNLAYSILKLKQYVQALTNENPKNPIINVQNNEIERIRNQIRDILKNDIKYTLSKKQILDGIDKIFDDIFGLN